MIIAVGMLSLRWLLCVVTQRVTTSAFLLHLFYYDADSSYVLVTEYECHNWRFDNCLVTIGWAVIKARFAAGS